MRLAMISTALILSNVSNYSASQTGHRKSNICQQLTTTIVKMCPFSFFLNWTPKISITANISVMCPIVQLLLFKNQKIKNIIYIIEKIYVCYVHTRYVYIIGKIIGHLDTSRNLLKNKKNCDPLHIGHKMP